MCHAFALLLRTAQSKNATHLKPFYQCRIENPQLDLFETYLELGVPEIPSPVLAAFCVLVECENPKLQHSERELQQAKTKLL